MVTKRFCDICNATEPFVDEIRQLGLTIDMCPKCHKIMLDEDLPRKYNKDMNELGWKYLEKLRELRREDGEKRSEEVEKKE